MVIGNGMIAKRFSSYQDNDKFILFASGVSNSKNIDLSEYNRETELLKKTVTENPGKTLVYFSTCSIYDPEEQTGLYVRHKIEKEDYIRQYADRYFIFRVSNIVGAAAIQIPS